MLRTSLRLSGLVLAVIGPAVLRGSDVSILSSGAVGDGSTVNTVHIQASIDGCAAAGGGTVVVPKGVFVTGALFFKPGVNLSLEEGGVLKASPNPEDFPTLPHVRFEGHFGERTADLLNVSHSEHFRLTGPGTIDGHGLAYWKSTQPHGRPRLCEICDSRDIEVRHVHFVNSPSWNLHFYDCLGVMVEDCRFEIPDNRRGPSTDGTDIDSTSDVLIKDCYYSVDDDCVCLKGNRYDGLNQEPQSPPVQKVRITGCTFVRGDGALSLGTEAQKISEVRMDHCLVKGKVPVLRIKFRPDTPGQDYSDVGVHDIQVDGYGPIISVEPIHGTKAPLPAKPFSSLNGLSVGTVFGKAGSFGTLSGGGVASVSGVNVRTIHVTFSKDPKLHADGVTGLTLADVPPQ